MHSEIRFPQKWCSYKANGGREGNLPSNEIYSENIVLFKDGHKMKQMNGIFIEYR